MSASLERMQVAVNVHFSLTMVQNSSAALSFQYWTIASAVKGHVPRGATAHARFYSQASQYSV